MDAIYGKVVVQIVVPLSINQETAEVRYTRKVIFSQHCEQSEAQGLADKFHTLTHGQFRKEATTVFVPNVIHL